MTTTPERDNATDAYQAAYTLQYVDDNLLDALAAHHAVIERYPESPQAAYSRTQIGNIARRVIPASKLVDAQLAMARRELERELE